MTSFGGGGTLRRLDRTTGTLTRIAGTGTFSSAAPGDGGPAVDAGLSLVRGLAVDADGASLLAGGGSGRVRRIDPVTGTIATVAGGGASLGDGGAASAARSNDPRQIALDPSSGDLLVAEYGGHRVRRIAAGADGRIGAQDIISTIAGDGTAATWETLGDVDEGPLSITRVAERTDGRLVLVDTTGNSLYAAVRHGDHHHLGRIAGTGSRDFTGELGRAPETALAAPYDVAITPKGNVLIADGGNNRIREVELAPLPVDENDEEPTPTPTPTSDSDPTPPATTTPAAVTPSPAPQARPVVLGKPRVNAGERTISRMRKGLTVTTVLSGATSVRVEVRVSAADARRLGLAGTRRLADVMKTVSADGTTKLKLRAGAAVRKRLAKARAGVRVTLQATASGLDGKQAVRSATFLLRA